MNGSFSDDMQKGTWIVTGGAGYLGKSLLLRLRSLGIRAIAFDNFSTSRRTNDPDIWEVELTDFKAVEKNWNRISGPVAGVFHFAAKALVGESRKIPHVYFENNLLSALHIARLCAQSPDSPPLIHSSSCAVYGNPEQNPITEETSLSPLSPYGASKRIVEEMFSQIATVNGLRVLNLRYFNPAGALEDLSHGECHEPETHLIPNAIRAALEGGRFELFGTDYPTPDGTCLRDYFHLEDLLDAHIAAASFLTRQSKSFCDALNIGSGTSISVKEVVRLVEEVTGKKIAIHTAPRREGDPANLAACIAKAENTLGWTPKRTVKQAIQSHLKWAHQGAL